MPGPLGQTDTRQGLMSALSPFMQRQPTVQQAGCDVVDCGLRLIQVVLLEDEADEVCPQCRQLGITGI